MKKIIIPIDFSENALNALQYAEALALQVRCDLLLVHVIPIQLVGATEVPVIVSPDEETIAHYTQKLDDLAKQVELENEFRFAVASLCTSGLFLDELLRQISLIGPEIVVVMGTRGASTFIDKLIGTNTASLMKHAPCPVLAIPVHAHFYGVHKIAYATDLTGKDVLFLNQLNMVTGSLGSEVSILHVKDSKHLKSKKDVAAFEEIVRQFPDRIYRIVEVKGNNVVEGIQTFINENNIDIIALAMHERGTLQELFHTSVSRQLAFQSTVPILTLPEKQIKFSGTITPETDKIGDYNN